MVTKVTRHPNCRCGADVGDNPYCIIHGRIRDMDQGASPFVDVDALAAKQAEELGVTEEDIDRTQDTGSYIEDMHRRNFDQELGEALLGSFDALKDAAPEGCKCDHSQDSSMWGSTGGIKRHHREDCPVHGSGPRQEYDAEGEAEEI